MAHATRTFRIFISSTFDDLKAERNALQRNCFPRLRRLCAEHGTQFQAIDLRWGVPSEAARDQRTMSICLDEIARCQHVSPRPNFIVLLGNRYGWRPLPEAIDATLFDKICVAVGDDHATQLLKQWYARDDNAIPAQFCLRQRTDEHTDDAAWQVVESRLRAALKAGVISLQLSAEERLPFDSSATEQEIEKGALRVDNAHEHVFCFFRDITNLPVNEQAASFRDMLVDGHSDDEAANRLRVLKARLVGEKESLGTFPEINSKTYSVDWTAITGKDSVAQARYHQQLCDDVYESLSRIILEELDLLEQIDELAREVDDHRSFGEERSQFFTGRASILSRITAYGRKLSSQPLIVHGVSGSGKSAVMARAARNALENRIDAAIITRFIGATPASADIRSLLQGLCQEIARAYDTPEALLPNDFRELVQHFDLRLQSATDEKPSIIFLDALDQLSSADGGNTLTWFPAKLPQHVRLVASVTPGDTYDALTQKISTDSLVQLDAMPENEGSELLGLWMDSVDRTLTTEQRAIVLKGFAACPYPLYLKLAFEEARLWHSSTPPEQTLLASDTNTLIRQLIERLSAASNHGEILTRHALGYLACAKNGLSEDEMLDILSADDDVWEEFLQRAHNAPPEQRIPAAVWSRFYLDLEPYLTERSADGAWLLSFYHRQLAETVESSCLQGMDRSSRHGALADYFEGQPLFLDEAGDIQARSGVGVDESRTANLRKLSELPFQQAAAGDRLARLYETLTDFDFMEAKCSYVAVTTQGQGDNSSVVYGGVYELQEDFRRALDVVPENIDSPGDHARRHNI